MFLLTQFIGLYVAHSAHLPLYLAPQISQETYQSPQYYFYQIVSSFIFAFLIFVLITKYKLKLFMRLWFFIVVSIALSISISTILFNFFGISQYWIALIFAILLGALKLFRPSMIIHNGTELLIYPGIAAIFVPLLSPIFIIILLVLVSIYDVWAVWKSGIMQKMAKFQMTELKIFGGFLIPYLTKNIRQKIANAKTTKAKKGLKIPIAILGGGDIFFPIFTSGVFYNAFGLNSALAVIFGSFAGLTYLMFTSEKKPYPAMPYITVGIFLGLAVWYGIRMII
jgi:presenilin-like A22 family membrane protease